VPGGSPPSSASRSCRWWWSSARGHASRSLAASWWPAKNRPVTPAQLDAVAYAIEEALRAEGGDITTERIGQRVLARLHELDEVAYLRFASVYKDFERAGDFQREAGLFSDPSSTGSDL